MDIMSSFIFYLILTIPCVTLAATGKFDESAQSNSLRIIYSSNNKLHAGLIKKISSELAKKDSELVILQEALGDKHTANIKNTDVIIAVGTEAAKIANRQYPKTAKLFISTETSKHKVDNNNAVLYMTQPYCKQILFIKLINKDWHKISLLIGQSEPHDIKKIQACASRYGMKIYTVQTAAQEKMTLDVKDALRHSDVLLALPGSTVYNSRTVKNILLTSYRYRKPVIGFSKNFVNAGALASVHSTAEQIAQSASILITHYFEQGHRFENTINYPTLFDIAINRQVFRALELSAPNVSKLKKTLGLSDPNKSGKLQ